MLPREKISENGEKGYSEALNWFKTSRRIKRIIQTIVQCVFMLMIMSTSTNSLENIFRPGERKIN
jgi:hypothetical protein